MRGRGLKHVHDFFDRWAGNMLEARRGTDGVLGAGLGSGCLLRVREAIGAVG